MNDIDDMAGRIGEAVQPIAELLIDEFGPMSAKRKTLIVAAIINAATVGQRAGMVEAVAQAIGRGHNLELHLDGQGLLDLEQFRN